MPISPKLRRAIRRHTACWLAPRRDELAAREQCAAKVRAYAEDGKVAMVTAGMDCDCSAWRDHVSLLPAIPRAVMRSIDAFYDNAEGPQSHYLAPPSTALQLEAQSRDLALEAFENGHAHVVRW